MYYKLSWREGVSSFFFFFFLNPLLAKILQAVMGILLSLILGIFKNKTHTTEMNENKDNKKNKG